MIERSLPHKWCLSPTEERLFHLLLRRQMVTLDAAMTTLYGNRSNPPYDKIVYVHIARIRKKLARHSVNITTVHGRGWTLENRLRYHEVTAEADEVARLRTAAKEVIATASDTYKKRNGHLGSFEDDSGEKCWIVPFDAFESLRSAVDATSAHGGPSNG